MKFPSYELLNKYAILHFRNVIHVDYSIIPTSSGWPFTRDHPVMSSKKSKGQDHTEGGVRRMPWACQRRLCLFVWLVCVLFLMAFHAFFQPQFLRVNELITNRFGHCWKKQPGLNALQMMYIIVQLKCGAKKAKRNRTDETWFQH